MKIIQDILLLVMLVGIQCDISTENVGEYCQIKIIGTYFSVVYST